jgi:hypothetical protein
VGKVTLKSNAKKEIIASSLSCFTFFPLKGKKGKLWKQLSNYTLIMAKNESAEVMKHVTL